MRSGIALLLLATLVVGACGGKQRRATLSPPPPAPSAPADTATSLEEEKTFSYDSHGARDPFVPVWIGRKVSRSGRAARPTFRVSAIAWDTVSPTAIINNRFVREGDTVSGARVVKINPSSVSMSFAGQSFSIRP